MKRKWRIGRVVLAIAILGVVTLTFRAWPYEPRWQVHAREVLGFDSAETVLFATDPVPVEPRFPIAKPPVQQVLKPTALVEGWDLRTGRLNYSATCAPKQTDDGPLDALPLDQAGRQAAVCRVRPEGVVAVELYALPSGEILHRLLIPVPETQRAWTDFDMRFSPDGGLLAVYLPFSLVLIDTTSGRSLATLEAISLGLNVEDQRGEMGSLRFSDDGRYLATRSNEGVTIFDLNRRRRVGRCPLEGYHIEFFPNVHILAVGESLNEVVDAYRVSPDGVVKVPEDEITTLVKDFRRRGVGAAVVHEEPTEWPDWLPRPVQEMLARWQRQGEKCLQLVYRNPQSELVYQRVSTPTVADSPHGYRFADVGTKSGRYLAITEGFVTTVWDIPPRRPLSCWLTCGGLALLATWVGWPRKVRPLVYVELKP